MANSRREHFIASEHLTPPHGIKNKTNRSGSNSIDFRSLPKSPTHPAPRVFHRLHPSVTASSLRSPQMSSRLAFQYADFQ